MNFWENRFDFPKNFLDFRFDTVKKQSILNLSGYSSNSDAFIVALNSDAFIVALNKETKQQLIWIIPTSTKCLYCFILVNIEIWSFEKFEFYLLIRNIIHWTNREIRRTFASLIEGKISISYVIITLRNHRNIWKWCHWKDVYHELASIWLALIYHMIIIIPSIVLNRIEIFYVLHFSTIIDVDFLNYIYTYLI